MSAFTPKLGAGQAGPEGPQGDPGPSAYAVAVSNGFVGTEMEWILSLQGKSAYELAVQQGFVGTLNEWILSLQGETTGAVLSVMGETGTVNQLDYLRFRTTAVTAAVVGALKWNSTDGTLDLPLLGGNVVLQIGQEQVLRVRNESGVALANGEAVYISGALSDRPTVQKAKADSNATSQGTIGIATEAIANNAEGYVTISGLVRDVNTSAFSEGDELWLSASTAGAYVDTKPSAPNHSVRLGWCVRPHVSQGIIFVNVDTGSELNEQHDVNITSPAANHYLRYNAGGYWENIVGPAGALVGTSDAQALTNKTIVAANNTITTAASGNLVATELNAALAELQGDIDTRQTAAQVASAIAALVDSSPDALNTLNELAAALGDDPNFATTITNALAGKVSKTGPETITANSASPALTITQTGAGNALVVEDAASPDSTPFVITGDGRIRKGLQANISFKTAANSTYAVVGQTFADFSAGDTSLLLANFSPSGVNFGATLCLARAGGAAIGDYTAVTNGLLLGNLSFNGAEGTIFTEAAVISAFADGTPGTNNVPGRLVFSTTPNGSATPVEAFRLDSRQCGALGGATAAGINFWNRRSLTGSTLSYGYALSSTVQSDVTTAATGYFTNLNTATASFTLTNLIHYDAASSAFGAGSSVTTQYGFRANSSLTGATNNYGFYSNIASGTGRWNFYANGTADNRFNGAVGLGKDPADSYTLDISGFQRTVGNAASIPIAYIENTSVNTSAIALRVVGGVSISRTGVTAPVVADGNVYSGTYTPTLTNVTNVASSTAFSSQYMRVGNVVTVSGRVDITPTAAATNTAFRMSLPVASNFGGGGNAGGTFAGISAAHKNAGVINADPANDALQFRILSDDNVSGSYYFTVTYQVI